MAVAFLCLRTCSSTIGSHLPLSRHFNVGSGRVKTLSPALSLLLSSSSSSNLLLLPPLVLPALPTSSLPSDMEWTPVFQASVSDSLKMSVVVGCQNGKVLEKRAEIRHFVNGRPADAHITLTVNELEAMASGVASLLHGVRDKARHLSVREVGHFGCYLVLEVSPKRRTVPLRTGDVGRLCSLAAPAVFSLKNYGSLSKQADLRATACYAVTLSLSLQGGVVTSGDKSLFRFRLARTFLALGIPKGKLVTLDKALEAGLPSAAGIDAGLRAIFNGLAANEIANM